MFVARGNGPWCWGWCTSSAAAHLVLVCDGPGPASVRVGGHALKHHLGGTQQHGACRQTDMRRSAAVGLQQQDWCPGPCGAVAPGKARSHSNAPAMGQQQGWQLLAARVSLASPGKHECAQWLQCCGGQAPDHCSRAFASGLTVCHVRVASDPPTVSCAPVHIVWLVVKDVFEGCRCSTHNGPVRLPQHPWGCHKAAGAQGNRAV